MGRCHHPIRLGQQLDRAPDATSSSQAIDDTHPGSALIAEIVDHSAMPLSGDYAPSTAGWARKQAERFEATGGAEAADLRGRPIIVLTSVGAKTGQLRKTALMRVEHDGRYAVVASKGGAAKHPVWYYNLRKNPHVELQDGPTKRDYLARELSGEEKALWWGRAVEVWPDYASYQAKTTREIPVFVLEPIEPPPAERP
jgi:deazaflavin-dependent oxidoreductase (nitroreductase family)